MAIPLRHQLVHTDDGRLDDLAGWTRSLSQGGRLRSLVDFGANSGDRTVTWLVDPALIDAVRRLAEGNPPRSLAANLQVGQDDGEDEATDDPSASTTPTEEPTETPTEDAESTTDNPLDLDELDPVVQAAAEAAEGWLARLGDAMRPEDQVMSLPYGDVDVSAAAEHDPQLYQRAVARAGTTLQGFDVTTTPVLSSPSGFLSTKAIRDAEPGSTILLTDAMFDAPAPPLADTEGHRVVVTSSAAGEGGPGPGNRTSITAMRQRLLSEAAVRFLRGRPGAADPDGPARLEPLVGQWRVLQRPRRGLARPHLGAGSEPGRRSHPGGRRHPALPEVAAGRRARPAELRRGGRADPHRRRPAEPAHPQQRRLRHHHRPGPRHHVVLRAHQPHRQPRVRRRIPGLDPEPPRAGARRGAPARSPCPARAGGSRRRSATISTSP